MRRDCSDASPTWTPRPAPRSALPRPARALAAASVGDGVGECARSIRSVDAGRVVTSESLRRQVWDAREPTDTERVRTFVTLLRAGRRPPDKTAARLPVRLRRSAGSRGSRPCRRSASPRSGRPPRPSSFAVSCRTAVGPVIGSDEQAPEENWNEQARARRSGSGQDFAVQIGHRRRRERRVLGHRRCACRWRDRHDRRLRSLLDPIASGPARAAIPAPERPSPLPPRPRQHSRPARPFAMPSGSRWGAGVLRRGRRMRACVAARAEVADVGNRAGRDVCRREENDGISFV